MRLGIFLGYHFHPGGVWSKDYLVADYADLRSNPEADPADIRISRTAEINVTKPEFDFPLKAHKEKVMRELKDPGGREGSE